MNFVSGLKPPKATELLSTIRSYFGNGGTWNPEMMDHDKVRDLIWDCQTLITHQTAALTEIATTDWPINLYGRSPQKLAREALGRD